MIEIRELVIKATVTQGEGGDQAAPQGTSAANGSDADAIQDYVEQVVKILEDKKER
ncbi:DUF5908 family protein [Pseudochryseolinea flava]|uniref:DUF5908 family protein n=1 Tax=Pseudochryseolinea flava TaxID=2059302 RepID=UPI0014022C46|nr:DUF5908 family protein [Pseudochryseolinea flava]